MTPKEERIGLENLPNVYIKKINVDTIVGQNYKKYTVAVKACIYDYLDEHHTDRSYWYHSEIIQKFMKTRCICVLGGIDSVKDIIEGNINIDEFNFFRATGPIVPEEKRIKVFRQESVSPTAVGGFELVAGKVHIDDQFTFTLTSTGDNYETQSIYVLLQNYIDLADLKSEYGLNLNYTKDQFYLGPLKAEAVMQRGEKVKYSAVFYKSGTNTVWPGSVYQKSILQFLAGAYPTANLGSVDRDYIENSKTFFSAPAQGYNALVDIRSGPSLDSSLVAQATAIMEAKEEMDERNQYECTFIMDSINLAIQYDHAARALYDVNPPLFFNLMDDQEMVTIDTMFMLRAPVNSMFSRNKLGTPIGVQPAPSHQEKFMCSTSQKNGKILSKARIKTVNGEALDIEVDKVKSFIAGQNSTDFVNISESDINQGIEESSITEIEGLGDKNLKFLHFQDASISNEKGKNFKYGVQVDFTCNLIKKIKKMMTELSDMIAELDAFHQIAKMPNAYDPKSGSYKKEFFISFHRQLGMNLVETSKGYDLSGDTLSIKKNALWFRAMRVFRKVNALVAEKTDPDVLKTIFSYLNLAEGDPNGILMVSGLFRQLKLEIERRYNIEDEDNIAFGSMSSGGKSTSGRPGGSKMNRSRFRHKKYFKKTMSVRQPKATGVSFIKVKKSKKKVPFLSKKAFAKRARAEKNKFFKSTPTATGINKLIGNDKSASGLLDLDKTSFSFFTPETIMVSGEEKRLLSVNNDIFDPDFFENLSLVKSANNFKINDGFSNNVDSNYTNFLSTVGMSVGVPEKTALKRKINEMEEHIDAREYLGDNSQFLPHDPNLFKLIYKPKKFLDIDKGVSRSFVSTMAKSRVAPPAVESLTLKSFSPVEENSNISKFFGGGKREKDLSRLPLQVKSLILADSDSVRFPLSKMDFDPLENPATSESVRQNFLNLKELKYLAGFKKSKRKGKHGLRNLSEPIYKALEDEQLKNDRKLLCRLEDYEDADIGIVKDDNELPSFNTTFIMGDEK